MSTWLKLGINGLIVLGRIGIVVAYLLILFPLGYVFSALRRTLPHDILHSQEFLLLPGNHTVTATALQSFPAWPYVLFLFVGTIIFIWAVVKHLKALIVILRNIQQADYFSATNGDALKQMVIARVGIIVSDVFLAGGNQLTRSWLYLVNNNGILSTTWGTIISDTWLAILFGVFYIAYRYTLTFKAENDLTI